MKFRPVPLDWREAGKKARRSPATEWHISLELLYSFTTQSCASNCTGTSCTQRGVSEGAESLHRSDPGLHAAAAEPRAEEALCSCCCEWPQEQEGTPGQAIASHRKPLGCLCLMLHPRNSSRRIHEPVRVHFGGGTLRPCRLPGPAHHCGLTGPSQVLERGLGGSLRHSSCQPLIETMATGLQPHSCPAPALEW